MIMSRARPLPRLLLALALAGVAPATLALEGASPPRLVDLAPAAAGDQADDRKVTRLGEYGATRAMQLQLKAGSSLPSHAAPERVLVVVLGGRGHFDFSGKIVPLHARQLLHMAPGEPHAVVAETDLDLLLVRIADAAGAPAPHTD